MEQELLDLVYRKFGSEHLNVHVVLPYVLGEYYTKIYLVRSDTSKVEVIGDVLVALARDKLEAAVYVKTELEERINLLEDMSEKISVSKRMSKTLSGIPERVFF